MRERRGWNGTFPAQSGICLCRLGLKLGLAKPRILLGMLKHSLDNALSLGLVWDGWEGAEPTLLPLSLRAPSQSPQEFPYPQIPPWPWHGNQGRDAEEHFGIRDG